MKQISGRDAALAVLHDPAFVVPPVPPESCGIGWLRATVGRLVAIFGGVPDEPVAARIGVLVQACDATATLIERARHRPVEDVLRDEPPVPATRRQALAATAVGDVTVSAGEVVRVSLADGLAFGAGPRRCPGRAHALALVEGALA